MSIMPITDGDQPQAPDAAVNGAEKRHGNLLALAIGSIGVVYGDIGTSPLYAFRESVTVAAAGGPISREVVIGVASLIVWALIIVVTIKYVIILLKADNNGEGGGLSLMALAQRVLKSGHGFVIGVSLAGAALFYGDAIITPAISVLSAIEGIKLVTPHFEEYVVPITVLILIVLFAVQRRGTAGIAMFFGPVMLVWFVAIGVLGLINIADDFGILAAFNPAHGLMLFLAHPGIGLVTLGAVFLSVTGAETLYADLGHFGRGPIRLAWFAVVFPGLTLNYLGQGALLLSNPAAIENPFYLLAPEWALIPLVGLATIATVTASQAVISGAFSVSRQAVQLGLLPRLEVRFTSENNPGQIYLPKVNTFLLIGVLALVFIFQTSSDLAAAYGISVTGTMVTTDLLAFVVVWKVWGWSRTTACLLMVPFLIIDLTFLGANMLKIVDGGWVPLLLAGILMLMMGTWRRGTRILQQKTRRTEVPLAALMHQLEKSKPHQVPGTAVYLTSDPEFAPSSLLHSLKHFRVLHENIVILTIVTSTTPRVDQRHRVSINQLSEHFAHVKMMFGYMETPNVPQALGLSRKLGWKFDIMKTSFFLSRRIIKPSPKSGMPLWQDHLFISMARHADDATQYFHIPTGRVVEIGTQVTV